MHAHFFQSDVLAETSPLDDLSGEIDMVHAASFIHLFDRPKQKQVVRRISRILKPQGGSACFGRQIGHRKPGNHEVGNGSVMFRHDAESFRQLWQEVGEEMGIEWDVKAELILDDSSFNTNRRPGDEDGGMLAFYVQRIT